MTDQQPVIANKIIKKFNKVLFGRATSRPYTPYTLLSDVTITCKDTRSTGTVTFQATGNLPDGRQIEIEGYAYRKGNSPWKFSGKGFAPIEWGSGMEVLADAYRFLLADKELPYRSFYKFDTRFEKPEWQMNQVWENW
jgi:hypothetical protein